MVIRATADKGEFKKGKEYDLPDAEAQAMVIAGLATFVAVAPYHNREKAIPKQWETRHTIEQLGE